MVEPSEDMESTEPAAVARNLVGFIYEERDEAEHPHLKQGDILAGHGTLLDSLVGVHPQFLDGCRGFLVLSQSCDLERRTGQKCKLDHISLAVVKSATEAMEEKLRSAQNEKERRGGFIKESKASSVNSFIVELLNNNTARYFFLPEEHRVKIDEHLCAFLSMVITIEVSKYDMCLADRIVGICHNFKAKLGWLVGDMYSRVGIPELTKYLGKEYIERQEQLGISSAIRLPQPQYGLLCNAIANVRADQLTPELVQQRCTELGLVEPIPAKELFRTRLASLAKDHEALRDLPDDARTKFLADVFKDRVLAIICGFQ